MTSSAAGTPRVLVVYGTRPEAIKLAPVIGALRERDDVDVVVCTTAQHRELVDQVHQLFGLAPDLDLDLMTADQQLNELTARVLTAVDGVLADVRPDWLVVQGDTSTAMASALAAFHRGVAVGHVEAGLRTGDLQHPFPEEANRRIIDAVAGALFAPTPAAAATLRREGADPAHVHVTGNPVVDALRAVAVTLGPVDRSDEVLITIHRRESFGAPLRGVFGAIARLAARFPSIRWVYPVHPNPNVRGPARELLGDVPNVELVEPLDYPDLVRHLMQARLVLTDSGGLQEEAPTFGTPVLVVRETTERPEGVEAGVARLTGLAPERIEAEVERLLTDERAHREMATAVSPYGDGRASGRIAAILAGGSWTAWSPGRPARHAS